MSYYKFDKVESSKYPHNFMAEELLVPRMENSNSQRINMFTSHLPQAVTLKNPEFPKVFTGFENQIGKYSTGYKSAKADFKIIEKIWKNKYNYDLIIQYTQNKKYDIIHYCCYNRITETYGSEIKECSGIKGKEKGDIVKANEMLYSTPSYDEDGTFSYGVNLKATYIPWYGLTYEDPIVISEEAAEKLTSYKVDQVYVSINGNNVLLNLYGNSQVNQALPQIGEHTYGNILCASREKNSRTIMYDFEFEKMSHIQYSDNITFCAGGKVVDIDVFSNKSVEELRKNNNAYMQQVADLLEEQNAYYEKLKIALEKIIPVATEEQLMSIMNENEKIEYNKERQKYIFDRPLPIEMNSNSYTEELGYTWKKVHEYLNSRIKWRHDGSSFNSVKVKFTILKENPLTPGCKLTGRYGNKGVVSLIEKSEKMPQTENGIKIDILLNPYGVINRMNISQLYEQKINFMSNHVVDIMKSKTTRKEKEQELFMYLLEINETEYNFVVEKYQKMTEEEKNNFIKDIEENGIYIHQRPFFGNITARDFLRINKEHPERCTKYKCTNLEKPITVGEVYFMRLKHESSNKSSIRSTDSINQKGLPLKSNVVKEHTKLFANTPIRFGEMEVANLMLCKDPEIVGEFMQTYSTSRIGREALVEKLLTAPDPLNITVEYTEDKSITRRILDQYLKVIELGLED